MTSSTDRIERQILLQATPARVYRALANAEEFGKWFCLDLKGESFLPGQHLRARLTYPGYEHIQLDMEIVRMEPESLFSYRWHPYAIDPAIDYSKEEPTLVEFKLERVEGGTQLTVVESGFDKVPIERRAEAFRMNSGGWEEQVENLADYVHQSEASTR